MVMVTDGKPVSVLPSWRRTEVVLYTCWLGLDVQSGSVKEPTRCHCNEGCIIAMCSVEITSTGASFKNSNAIIILDWESPKEAYKADLVVDLVICKLLRFPYALVDYTTFSSGLDDIAAAGCFVQRCGVLYP